MEQSTDLSPLSDDPLEDPEAYRSREMARAERGYLRNIPYDARLAAIIVSRVAEGQLLTSIIAEYHINMGSIRKWRKRSEEFRDALRDAEALGAQALIEQTVELADQQTIAPGEAMRAKLQVETRMKLAGKMDPQRWGDKIKDDGGFDLGAALDRMKDRRKEMLTQPVFPTDAQQAPI